MNNRKYIYPLLAAILLVGTATSVVTVAGAASTGASTIMSSQTATGSTGSPQAGTRPQRTPPAAFGKVTAVSGTTITISDQKLGASTATTYTVNASGATVTKDRNSASTVSAIAVGDMIAVEGTVSGTTVTATAIHDGIGFPGGPGGHGGFGGPGGGGAVGTVTAVSGTTLTVTGKDSGIYTVDASSATVKESGSTSSVGAIKVGDTVMIRGNVKTATMIATDIEDGIPTPPAHGTTSTSAIPSTQQ